MVRAITEAGGKTTPVRGSALKAADAKAIDAAIKVYGRLDILLNNSGISEFFLLEDITEEKFHKSFNINAAPFSRHKPEPSNLREGAIINIG